MGEAFESLYIVQRDEEYCKSLDPQNDHTSQKKHVLAFVNPGRREGSRYVINICESFWGKGQSSNDRTGTMIHEVTHHFGTVDHAYSKKDCKKLRFREAQNNADTFTGYMKDVVKLKEIHGEKVYEEGTGTKHPLCDTDCDQDVWHDP